MAVKMLGGISLELLKSLLSANYADLRKTDALYSALEGRQQVLGTLSLAPPKVTSDLNG